MRFCHVFKNRRAQAEIEGFIGKGQTAACFHMLEFTAIGYVVEFRPLPRYRNLLGIDVGAEKTDLGINHGQGDRGTSRSAPEIEHALDIRLHVGPHAGNQVLQMMIDDPEGATFWKVTHGIRLSGMPGFVRTLSDTERWQVTMLVAHADRLSPSVKAALTR